MGRQVLVQDLDHSVVVLGEMVQQHGVGRAPVVVGLHSRLLGDCTQELGLVRELDELHALLDRALFPGSVGVHIPEELGKLPGLQHQLPQGLVADLELCRAAGGRKVAVEADEREIVDCLLRVWCAEVAGVVAYQAREVDLFLAVGAKGEEFLIGLQGIICWSQQAVICESDGEMDAINEIKRVQIMDSLLTIRMRTILGA